MCKMPLMVLAGLFVLAASGGTVRGESWKTESIGALTETSVSEPVRTALESKGTRVVDDKGKVLCEIWLRREIPATGEDVAGAIFSKIGEGTLAGVIHFPAQGGDYRGQGIKGGWYTMRYGLILQDGNHLGVSQTRDFLLFCPVATDVDPTKQLSIDEMMKQSRAASGTGHPSIWSMLQPTEEKNLPRIVRNEHEHVIIEISLTIKGGALPIALVIQGKTEG